MLQKIKFDFLPPRETGVSAFFNFAGYDYFEENDRQHTKNQLNFGRKNTSFADESAHDSSSLSFLPIVDPGPFSLQAPITEILNANYEKSQRLAESARERSSSIRRMMDENNRNGIF